MKHSIFENGRGWLSKYFSNDYAIARERLKPSPDLNFVNEPITKVGKIIVNTAPPHLV